MRALRVDLDVSLPEDELVDLFVFQCFSPPPLEAGALGKLPADVCAKRQTLIDQFALWLQKEYFPRHAPRPVIALMPELSVCISHVDALIAIAKTADRPMIVVAGLEFMTWAEYSDLLARLVDMPEPESWRAGGNDHHIVNAALIATRDAAGTIRTFIQPKRNPSDVEGANHFPCENALLFQSQGQRQGRRLNFCVQICADFTNPSCVHDLRLACEEVAEGRPIDFTFVLQRNKNQDAAQFKRSIEAYFATPAGVADTSHGCLVFVNNANEQPGKSVDWGRSMLLFPFNKRWRTSCSPTYWLKDEAGHNYQAVVVREAGPSLYWLRYRPHYLVNQAAGSGQPVPFAGNHALSIELSADSIDAGDSFRPIPAITHWLLSEWRHGLKLLVERLGEGAVPADVVDLCSRSYDESMEAWRLALTPNDMLARHAVALYFAAFPEKVFAEATPEPQLWDDDTSQAIQRFLEAYSIVHATVGNADIAPQPDAAAHAHLRADTEIMLLWGRGKLVSSLVTRAHSILSRRAYSSRARTVVILVEPRDNPAPDELKQLAATADYDITKGERADGEQAIEDVTRATPQRSPLFICDQGMSLSGVTDVGALRARVGALLGA